MKMPETEAEAVDVVVVGAGPAGLSAALVLGRACKRVWLFDAGPRRNAAAAQLHGFVTRDGTPPETFRGIAREQLAPYDVLFLKPVQHLPPLVQALGPALDEAGYLRVSPQGETSIPGLFAVGDLTTPLQAAMVAAYQGAVAGWTLVHDLNLHGVSSAP